MKTKYLLSLHFLSSVFQLHFDHFKDKSCKIESFGGFDFRLKFQALGQTRFMVFYIYFFHFVGTVVEEAVDTRTNAVTVEALPVIIGDLKMIGALPVAEGKGVDKDKDTTRLVTTASVNLEPYALLSA